jgi:polyribonucleotide nucleotidyltransferase
LPFFVLTINKKKNMNLNIVTKEITLNDGRIISIETGRLAKQANGAVVVKMGDTMLLATAVTKKDASENVDFLPLSVDYQEKYAAAGRFPGGFFKREARPSEYEILVSRYVDRALRPLFPEDYHAETQVLITLISAEKNAMPDALACLAASAALSVSDIPFNGPVSEVRVARVNGVFLVNPSMSEIAEADIEMIIAGSLDNIVMVEGEMKEVQESDMIEAIKVAHEAIKIQCQAQLDMMQMVEKAQNKTVYCHEKTDPELEAQINEVCFGKLYDLAKSGMANKQHRSEGFEAIKKDFIASLSEEDAVAKAPLIKRYFHNTEKEAVRKAVLNEGIRLDGRKTNEIRPIWSIADYLPSAHGSAVFTRGETQSLTTVTLGTKLDEQVLDGAVIEGKSKFILHYNFPPFSTGEVKMMRGTGRREIGHGNLALRALKPVLPSVEDNPYTIRVVSDILESNGSSSMATVCAGTIALMDAGVKITKPVSGIAMGLISDSKTKQFAVLSDILGDEDHLGDMDFKVTGTRDGITACQMDIKIDGLSYEILISALNQAKEGRLHILDKIEETIKEPRADYKPFVPRLVKMTIPKEFIGAIIGPGGKIIQEMQREFACTITIEEVGETGIVDIFSENKDSIDGVMARIKGIVAVPEVGDIYKGKVKSVMPFGLFVEILPGKDGLLHISEIDWKRFEKTEDAGFQVGDMIDVKLIEVDKKTGKLKLSRKVLLDRPERS